MENFSMNNTNNSTLSSAQLAGTIAPKTEIEHAVERVQVVTETKETQNNNIDPKDQDKARFQAVKQAAKRIIEMNPFPVSDVRFTIYKDTLGDQSFVTRFTSLKDGKVTIVSEGDVMSSANSNNGAVIQTTA